MSVARWCYRRPSVEHPRGRRLSKKDAVGLPFAGSQYRARPYVPDVTRHAKLLVRLLSGTADRAFRFDDLCALLRRLGFAERQRRGSHHIFTRGDVAEILNLQPRSGGEAKPYQVRQVRDVVLKYSLADLLTGEQDDEA